MNGVWYSLVIRFGFIDWIILTEKKFLQLDLLIGLISVFCHFIMIWSLWLRIPFSINKKKKSFQPTESPIAIKEEVMPRENATRQLKTFVLVVFCSVWFKASVAYPLFFLSICLYFFFLLWFFVVTKNTYSISHTFDGGLGMLSMSFKRLKAVRNEELFLFDLIHLCCIWAIDKYKKGEWWLDLPGMLGSF